VTLRLEGCHRWWSYVLASFRSPPSLPCRLNSRRTRRSRGRSDLVAQGFNVPWSVMVPTAGQTLTWSLSFWVPSTTHPIIPENGLPCNHSSCLHSLPMNRGPFRVNRISAGWQKYSRPSWERTDTPTGHLGKQQAYAMLVGRTWANLSQTNGCPICSPYSHSMDGGLVTSGPSAISILRGQMSPA
jgi:hypothetical protein